MTESKETGTCTCHLENQIPKISQIIKENLEELVRISKWISTMFSLKRYVDAYFQKLH